MKRTIFILFLTLLFAIGSHAQQRAGQQVHPRITGTLKTDYKKNKKGTPITLIRVSNDMQLITTINGQQVAIPARKAAGLFELAPKNTDEFWFREYIGHSMFTHYKRKGYRHPLRGEVMNEAGVYLSELNGLFYEEEFTCSYMENIFANIAPQRLDKKRPERLRIEILKSPNPDAYMLGNGTLLISTGLLSVVDSADELMAVMASEIAHYVLDHQVVNVAKERSRVRKAKIWGSVLSFVAIGLETAIAENNEHYIPGGIFLTASIAGEIMNTAAIEKLGMGYSDMQYFEADDIAVKFLKMNNMNTSALSSALYKIKEFYKMENDSHALSRKGGYGNVNKRIARLETSGSIVDPAFLRRMSEVTTFNAMVHFNNKNYQATERLIEKKMNNGCATDDDYLVYVQANMGYTNSPEDNERNLEFIRRVKTISDIPNLGLYKQEILLLHRLERKEEAIDAIKEYESMIIDFKQQATAYDDINWADGEISWCNKRLSQN